MELQAEVTELRDSVEHQREKNDVGFSQHSSSRPTFTNCLLWSCFCEVSSLAFFFLCSNPLHPLPKNNTLHYLLHPYSPSSTATVASPALLGVIFEQLY